MTPPFTSDFSWYANQESVHLLVENVCSKVESESTITVIILVSSWMVRWCRRHTIFSTPLPAGVLVVSSTFPPSPPRGVPYVWERRRSRWKARERDDSSAGAKTLFNSSQGIKHPRRSSGVITIHSRDLSVADAYLGPHVMPALAGNCHFFHGVTSGQHLPQKRLVDLTVGVVEVDYAHVQRYSSSPPQLLES